MANRKDDGDYHNVRCGRNNPQHVYVNKILSDLNMDIYKKMEKTQTSSYLFNSNQSSPYESMRHAHSYGQFKR